MVNYYLTTEGEIYQGFKPKGIIPHGRIFVKNIRTNLPTEITTDQVIKKTTDVSELVTLQRRIREEGATHVPIEVKPAPGIPTGTEVTTKTGGMTLVPGAVLTEETKKEQIQRIFSPMFRAAPKTTEVIRKYPPTTYDVVAESKAKLIPEEERPTLYEYYGKRPEEIKPEELLFYSVT